MSDALMDLFATDGPMEDKLIPFAREGSPLHVVRLRNGDLRLARHPGHDRHASLGQYVYEDGKAVWMPR
jgi:hypothetical protein